MVQISVHNRLLPSDKVNGATITLRSAAGAVVTSATTNAHGVATINTNTLANGVYPVSVAPKNTMSDPIGAATAEALSLAETRIFRSVSLTLTVTGGKATAAALSPADMMNGDVKFALHTGVAVGLQPCFMRSPNHRSRGSHDISMIIVHHTDATTSSTLATFIAPHQTSANYVIDRDGQIIKMVPDSTAAFHAGEAQWAGDKTINEESIGIEIVHKDGDYAEAQYVSLLRLITSLRGAHATIVDWNIIGHSDVATTHGKLGRKSSDPGLKFEWRRLEEKQLGMLRFIGPPASPLYAGYFDAFADGKLRHGDNDAKRIFGGHKRPASYSGDPVLAVQNDLAGIGYCLGRPDGDFGGKTVAAVHMFQEHFFAGARGHKAPDGVVDLQTAMIINSVASAKP